MHDLIIIGGGPAALSAAAYALGKQLDGLMVYEKLGGKAGTQQHLRGQSGAGAAPGVEVARALEREIEAQPERTLCERDSSIQRNNQKIVTEAPAPYLSQEQREQLWRDAIEIARLFGCRSACTVEFVIDEVGRRYFTEVKARIQIEHSITEMLARVDIVREQIRIAAGEPLSFGQADVQLSGSAMQCRINAEDPWNRFLPSPGRISGFRIPGGPFVRLDTYAYSGCDIPLHYDSIFAKLVTWDVDRDACVNRMRHALEECAIAGIQTNIPRLHGVLNDQNFIRGVYTTEFSRRPLVANDTPDRELHDLAPPAPKQMRKSFLTEHL